MANRWLNKLAWLFTIVTLFVNIYVFTYPSFNADRCSWGYEFKKDSVGESDGLFTIPWVPKPVQAYLGDVFKQIKGANPARKKDDIRLLAIGDPQLTGAWAQTSYIKRLDIYGNDWFLGHIFRTMKSRLSPSHVAVMGDILSSQWIGDEEFFRRTKRFTERLLGRDSKWLMDLKNMSTDASGEYRFDWKTYAVEFGRRREANEPQQIQWDFQDVAAWTPADDYLLINITGNHDIGYSGDTTYQHLTRYRDLYGSDSYWIEYDNGTDHPWRLVVLNNMLLEGPALQPEFVDATWEFLQALSERNYNGTTILLTHMPFYKPANICADGPEFKYYPPDYPHEVYKRNLLRSQNHLSQQVSNIVLDLIFSNGKPGVILTGHDHEGCQTYYRKNSNGTWDPTASLDSSSLSTSYIREITVRSIMGEYGGVTGLLTGNFNQLTENWDWSYSLCPFAVQHVWWASKVSIALTILTWTFVFLF